MILARQRQQITTMMHRHQLILTDYLILPKVPIEPIAGVVWFRNGWKCDFPNCTYICRSRTPMQTHCHLQHQWKNPYSRGGSQKQRRETVYPWRYNINCQRLFAVGSKQTYFEVIAPTTTKPAPQASPDPPERLYRQLQQQLQTANAHQSSDLTIAPGAATEANPWLRRTRWDQHLQGQQLADLAALVELPRNHETILQTFGLSIDRIIANARTSVLQQKINIFDQTALNMFNEHQVKAGQPFQDKLQKGTYQRYKGVWKKLLCFIYRLDQARDQGRYQDLPYCLTSTQRVGLDRSIKAAKSVIEDDELEGNTTPTPCPQLDQNVLRFSMALLDHQLRGDIYESFLVGFIAVLGIDAENVS